MKNNFYLLIIALLLLVASCSQIQKVTDIVVQPSAREIYARDFDASDSLFVSWNASFKSSKNNQLQIAAPFTLSGKFNTEFVSSLGYKIALQQGERLIIEVLQPSDSSQVFIDVFQYQNDSTLTDKPIIASDLNKSHISLDIENSSNYKIIIQPEIANASAYDLKIYTQPMFAFPVSGYDNKAILSFWGADRDAGRRSHEGVDIFAKRGTPIIAVTDGIITYTGEKGLGGKQVWQRAGILGNSIYYAHLDSIAISGNSRVKLGDTIGFVGNTGNARTTSPHLHFGIYTRSGAIDPLPFIKKMSIPEIKTILVNEYGITKKRNNELRIGPDKKFNSIQSVDANKKLMIMGKSADWYHVKVSDGLEGFIHNSLLSLE